jgi:uncharacterized repeat protein (TIGR01451 family)/LPXTG-motif cell wall-anchored protein
MSKLTSLIRRAPKRTSGIVAMIALAVIVPVAALAWGPSRDTFTVEKPSDHVTFNSITNNPSIGDERNFVGIRETSAANTWYDDVTVQPGKEYYVRMYVHNNAAANLNLVAENVTAKFNLPTNTAKSIQVNGFLNASNVGADTKGNKGAYAEVYDQATFNSTTNFNLAYVKDSLKYENNAFGPNGTTLSESIFTSAGTKLGYDKLDGKIPGCFQYDGYVTFKVKPQFEQTTNFTLTKKVSKHGEAKWADSYAAQPGEVVDFLLAYKNTGEVQHDDVTFRDTLPTGLSHVAAKDVNGKENFGVWSNASTQNNPITTKNLTNGTGINVGSYAKGANAFTTFSAKVASKEQLKCGDNTLVNKGKVNTGGYAVEDTATVTVKKECLPEVKKITVCELATKKIVTIDEKDFNTSKYSKDLDDCKEIVKNINVCELATKKIITINEKDYDAKKHSKNLDDCKEVPTNINVCELATKKVITIDEKNFDATKHSKNLDDCKTPETPEQMNVCEIETKKIVTIEKGNFDETKYTTDLTVCEVTPETPPELPHTGAGDNIVAILGLGSLVAGVAYYVASRRALGL